MKGGRLLKMTVLLLVCCSAGLAASDLFVRPYEAGGWQIQLDGSSLSFGAGSDFIDSFTSSVVCDRIDVDTDSQDDEWSILVFLQSDPSPFTVEILITDEGTGVHAVTFTDDFQSVSTESMTLISGKGDRSDISVQYRVSGISIETISSTQYDLGLLYVLSL